MIIYPWWDFQPDWRLKFWTFLTSSFYFAKWHHSRKTCLWISIILQCHQLYISQDSLITTPTQIIEHWWITKLLPKIFLKQGKLNVWFRFQAVSTVFQKQENVFIYCFELHVNIYHIHVMSSVDFKKSFSTLMARPCMLQAEYLIVRRKNGQKEDFTMWVFFFCMTLDPPTR